jgi:hypothetical protein
LIFEAVAKFQFWYSPCIILFLSGLKQGKTRLSGTHKKAPGKGVTPGQHQKEKEE